MMQIYKTGPKNIKSSPLMRGDNLALIVIDPAKSQATNRILGRTGTPHTLTHGKVNGEKVSVLVLSKATLEDAASFAHLAGADSFVFAYGPEDNRSIATVHSKASRQYRMGDEHKTTARLAKNQDIAWVALEDQFIALEAEAAVSMTKHEKTWAILAMHQISTPEVTPKTSLAHPHFYAWREAKASLETPTIGLSRLLTKAEPSIGSLAQLAKSNLSKIIAPAIHQYEPAYQGQQIKPTFNMDGMWVNACSVASKLGFQVKNVNDLAKAEVGQNTYEQGVIFVNHSASESDRVWQLTHELAHAITSDKVDFTRNKVLSKSQAEKVVAWEIAAMRLQKNLLDGCGFFVTDEAWARETNIIIADTISRLAKTQVEVPLAKTGSGHWSDVLNKLSCSGCGNLSKMCKCENVKKGEKSASKSNGKNPQTDFDIESTNDRLKVEPDKKNQPAFYGKGAIAPPFGTKINDKTFDGEPATDPMKKGKGTTKMAEILDKNDMPPTAMQSTSPPAPSANKGISGSTAPKMMNTVGRPKNPLNVPQAPKPPMMKNDLPESGEEAAVEEAKTPDSLKGQYSDSSTDDGDPDLQAALAKWEANIAKKKNSKKPK